MRRRSRGACRRSRIIRSIIWRRFPRRSQDKLTANDVIQEDCTQWGRFSGQAGGFRRGAFEWDRLLGRYPDNIYRLDVYYNPYIMYMRQGKTAGPSIGAR